MKSSFYPIIANPQASIAIIMKSAFSLSLLVLFLCRVMASPAVAQSDADYVFSPEADRLDITVYSNNFAMVYETRVVELQAGVNQVLFHGLPDPHEISDLQFLGDARLFGSATVLQPRGMRGVFQELTGEKITLRGPAGRVDGTLSDYSLGMLSIITDEGDQLIITNPGSYTVHSTTGSYDLRRETGVMAAFEAERAGTYEIGLLYYTGGLGWTAEHQLQIDEETETLEWLTLSHIQNNTSAGFEGANVQLFSGEIRTNVQRPGVNQSSGRRSYQPVYIYELGTVDELPRRERAQIRSFFADNVEFEKEYHHRFGIASRGGNERYNQKPNIMYRIPTGDGTTLGEVLPSGSLRLLDRSTESPALIGDTSLGTATEPGEELLLGGSTASDISIDEIMTSNRPDGSDGPFDIQSVITLRNGTDDDAVMMLTTYIIGNMSIDETNVPVHKRTENEVEFRIELEPGEEFEFRLLVSLPGNR